MKSTFFLIPETIPGTGIPIFGLGLLLGVWAVLAIVWAAWLWRSGRTAELRSGFLVVLLVGAAIGWLAPRMVEPGKGLPIRGYGTFLLLAVVSGLALALYRARQLRLDAELIYSLATWMFVGGIVGARLFYVWEYWHRFSKPSWGATFAELLKFTQGGLVVYGALIGGVLAWVAFCMRYRQPAWALADLVAPSLALGYGIGRIGCLMQGCCFGGPSELPWAVTFPWGSPPHADQVMSGKLAPYGLQITTSASGEPSVAEVASGSPAASAGVRVGDRIVAINDHVVADREQALEAIIKAGEETRSIDLLLDDRQTHRRWQVGDPPPRSNLIHPAQLYDAITGLLLCWFLWNAFPFRRRDGEIALLMVSIYPVTRFLMEWIRVDEPGQFGTEFSIAQWLSIALFIAAAAAWAIVLQRPKFLAYNLAASGAIKR